MGETIRLSSQLNNIYQYPPQNWRLNFQYSIHNDSTYLLTIYLKGTDTTFQGLPIKVIVTVPSNYPYQPPIFKIAEPKKFSHPNINPTTGRICDQISLTNNPSHSIRDRVQGFVALFENPNSETPFKSKYNHDRPDIYYRAVFNKFRKL